MKNIVLISIFAFLVNPVFSQKNKETQLVDSLMSNWHNAAAIADANTFFGFMDADCIYIGTDASEKWKRDELKKWSEKAFQRKSAWDFKTINREIYFSKNGQIAWFDEQLNTWMGVCQASGVLEKNDGKWLLKHYQLSVTIANEKIKSFIEISK